MMQWDDVRISIPFKFILTNMISGLAILLLSLQSFGQVVTSEEMALRISNLGTLLTPLPGINSRRNLKKG
jgi:hypothetical protein